MQSHNPVPVPESDHDYDNRSLLCRFTDNDNESNHSRHQALIHLAANSFYVARNIR
jgi:hypothetical protein